VMRRYFVNMTGSLLDAPTAPELSIPQHEPCPCDVAERRLEPPLAASKWNDRAHSTRQVAAFALI
jgi:hypothetical protein